MKERRDLNSFLLSSLVKSGKEKYHAFNVLGAEKDFKKALQISCTDHYAYFCLGNLIYEHNGDLNLAMEYYTKALQVNFDCDIYLFYLEAVKKEQLKDHKGAVDCFSSALEIDPDDHITYFFRGNVKYYDLEDYNGAILDYLKGIEINPLNIKLLGSCASCYKELKDYQNSILFYTKAIKALVDCSKEDFDCASEIESRFYRGRSHVRGKTGDIQGRINDMDKAAFVEPNAKMSKTWRFFLREEYIVNHLNKSFYDS